MVSFCFCFLLVHVLFSFGFRWFFLCFYFCLAELTLARESKSTQRTADLPAYYQALLSKLVTIRKARKVKFVSRGVVRQLIIGMYSTAFHL
jgi:hypothetical protein